MNPETTLKILLPAFIILLSCKFFFISFKTLFSRRPLIFSTRWIFAFLCIAFLPSLSTSFITGGSKDVIQLHWINLLMFIGILIIMWIQLKGYIVYAVYASYLREALLASTKSLGITVEETLSCLKITETGGEIQVAIQD
jgi:hypothetical protein